MTKRKSVAASAPDPDAVLAELLTECRDGVRTCFELGNDPGWDVQPRCEAMNVAARLMKTSIALAAALKKNADFTHRIIVERPAPNPPHEGPHIKSRDAAGPPPGQISGKTIHGVEGPQGSQD